MRFRAMQTVECRTRAWGARLCQGAVRCRLQRFEPHAAHALQVASIALVAGCAGSGALEGRTTPETERRPDGLTSSYVAGLLADIQSEEAETEGRSPAAADELADAETPAMSKTPSPPVDASRAPRAAKAAPSSDRPASSGDEPRHKGSRARCDLPWWWTASRAGCATERWWVEARSPGDVAASGRGSTDLAQSSVGGL
jgi:hypothetical protein